MKRGTNVIVKAMEKRNFVEEYRGHNIYKDRFGWYYIKYPFNDNCIYSEQLIRNLKAYIDRLYQ